MDRFIKKIDWKTENGIVQDVFLGEESIALPWGVETADSWAFFSLDKSVGYRYEILSQSEEFSDDELRTSQVIKMREGKWILETKDLLSDNKIVREATLTCLEDSIFMDFVLRFRFKNKLFHVAEINEQAFLHKNENIYHQYKAREVFLKGEQKKISIRILDISCGAEFSPEMYVRDQVGEWVVHARMMPVVYEKIVIKLCSKYFRTSPCPQFLTNLILKINKLKTYLWYRSEHSPYKSRLMKFFAPNAFPMAKLKKGEKLFWKVEVSFNE